MVRPNADNPAVPDVAPTLASPTAPETTVAGNAETIQEHHSDASRMHLTGGMPKQAERFRERAPGDVARTQIDPNPSVPPRPNVHGGD